MVESTGYVLFHVLLVLFPILFYHFYNNNNNNNGKPCQTTWRLTFILIIMLLLTMTYPLEYPGGYRYDFRAIPVIIAFVYAGTVPGLLTVSILMLYRFVIGGPGFILTLISYTIAAVLLLFITKRFCALQVKRKVLAVSFVLLSLVLSKWTILLETAELDQLQFMFVFYAITWTSLITVVYIMENVNQQQVTRRELQRADKLNVISQLAASVAHEVRNPMTAVRGFLQLINNDGNLDDNQRNYIKIAINELDHAQIIINDYLSLAKSNTAGLAPINISSELKNTLELMTSYSNIQNIALDLQSKTRYL
ncbi:histidine kinase dimerization/phospho-acceptor domain-containing protein [Bacillus sp. M6-12]|uniref:histidine kinase dimerization/phospho-acceptor domain-containing protein n=1 Tax=Bacillus sp. M6-12 TaxID=2054166 RepID=UPI00215579A9|nr:histidine kinase dimerization/phospho-acceptor domain-containing protein [Bacillus sp. M6-12]